MVEKLAEHKIKICRVGHPARILPATLSSSLDSMVFESDSAQLCKDIRNEMNNVFKNLRKTRERSEKFTYKKELTQLRKELKQRESKAVVEVLDNADVILTTLTGAGAKSLYDKEFDIVVSHLSLSLFSLHHDHTQVGCIPLSH